MTDKEIKELTSFERNMKRWFLGGGGTVILAIVTFYFNTGFTLEAHEERLDEHDMHTEEVIILKHDVINIKNQNAIFMEQYQRDRDRIIDLLLQIKEDN